MKKKTDKIKKPMVGDKIYVDSSFYISHGEDDFVGGLATISGVSKGMSAGDDTWFVSIVERPGHEYNYEILVEGDRQKKLKKEFGRRKPYPDPDPVSSPW